MIPGLGLGRATLAVGGVLVGLSVLGSATLLLARSDRPFFVVVLVQAGTYAVAAWLIVKRPSSGSERSSHAVAAILLLGLLMRLPAIVAQPVSSDVWRYIWDGRVQAAGVNPYVHVPGDAALSYLRDLAVYPNINRADYAPTIYPPTAQIVFFLVTRLGESVAVMKAAMVAFDALAVWAILRLLAARGLPATRVLLYAWHPLPIWEFAGSAHVDAVAIAFLLLAFLAAERRSPFLAGAALAAGTFVKYFPIVAGPAIYRRRDWRLLVAFAVTGLLLYLPYFDAGSQILGFLPGYVAEEGLQRGSGLYLWMLLTAVLPLPPTAAGYYLPAAALVLATVALVLFVRRQQPGADLAAAMILGVTFVVLMSPHYPWYFAWLVPFLCFYPVAAVVYLTGAATYIHLADGPPSLLQHTVLYGPFFILLTVEAVRRRSPTSEM